MFQEADLDVCDSKMGIHCELPVELCCFNNLLMTDPSTEFPRIDLGHVPSSDAIETLYAAVLDRSLPKQCWTHGAHLVFALTYLSRHDLKTARAEMPDLIRRYNEATNTPNTDTDGYHETITQFYLGELEAFRREHGGATLKQAVSTLLKNRISDRDHALRAYSRERLFSVEARREWIQPDLRPA